MLGDNLAVLRKDARLTQSDISKILGIDRSTYAYYEENKTTPTLANLISLARIFNVSVDELLGVSSALLLNDSSAPVLDSSLSEATVRMSDLSEDERMLIAKLRTDTSGKLAEILSKI